MSDQQPIRHIPRDVPGMPVPSYVRHRLRTHGPAKPGNAGTEPTVARHWNDSPARPAPPVRASKPWRHYYYAVEWPQGRIELTKRAAFEVAIELGYARVYRFASDGDRGVWVARDETGRRERLGAEHPLVKVAKRADEWPELDEDAL